MIQTARHQCMVYQGQSMAHLARLVPAMIQKLGDQHRCIFLGNITMVSKLREDLHRTGLDVAAYERRGSLLLKSDQNHLIGGTFELEHMLTLAATAVAQARQDGYKGLWGAGDMTWEFGAEENLTKLLDYECAMERMFEMLPEFAGVCMYHRDTLPLEMISHALYTHQSVYINHTCQRKNPYYKNPDAILSSRPSPLRSFEVERMIHAVTA